MIKIEKTKLFPEILVEFDEKVSKLYVVAFIFFFI